MAERAVAMAREAPEDPWCGLADPDELARGWDVAALDLVDPEPLPTPDALQAAALAAEAAALAVPGRQQDGRGRRRLVGRAACTSPRRNGFSGGYGRTGHSIQAVAICGEGTGDGARLRLRGPHATAPTCPTRPRSAASPASAPSRAPGAGKPPTGAFPVLYDERVAAGLIGHLVQAINGAAVARGASWLKDALGERGAARRASTSSRTRSGRASAARGRSTARACRSARRALVADGVLQGWILDLATARQLGLTSTGNAGARHLGAADARRAGNLALTQGAVSREALLAEMGTGLLVTSLIGASINPTTGDYSRGASGFWVENGEIVRPVNECTIAGNLRDDAARRSARPTTRAAASLAGGAEPPRRGAGHCRKLTSRCSRRRRGRRARSRSRRVGDPGRGAREAGGLGPVSEADLAVDRMLRAELLGGAARLWLALGGERGRPRSGSPPSGSSSSTRSTAPAPSSPAQPAWALSLAVVEAGRVVAGVVHLPALGRTYAAAAGGGARG